MRDILIDIFLLIPFVANLLSIVAGILLYFWLIWQRRKRDAARGESNK